MIVKSLTSLVGNTPMLEVPLNGSRILLKIESFNPAGSIKDRVALGMILDAQERGLIKKGATVQYSIVAENAVIEENAVVGKSPESMENIEDWGVSVIGSDVTIGKGAVIGPKEMIDENVGGAE